MKSLTAKAAAASAKAEQMKPIDVESTVQAILQGDTKDGFSTLVTISCSNHTFFSQWKSIEWKLSTFKGMVEVVRRYEVDELKYDGRSAWILYMMLEYGAQDRSWAYFEDNRELINTMIATLLRILIEHSNYNQIFLIFRTLQNSYGLNPSEVFIIGCSLLEQLPAAIKDVNFIALLDLVVVSIEHNISCLASAVKMLAYCSNFVICDWKSNFFLDQKLDTLSKAFIHASTVSDMRQQIEMIFDTIQLFRRLATIHEKNALHILVNKPLIDVLMEILFRKASVSTPAHIHREILATFNVLTRVSFGSNQIRSLLSCSDLRNLIAICDDLLVTEVIVDLFFTLYEGELEYWDDAFHYVIQDASESYSFINYVLQQCVQVLSSDFQVSSVGQNSTRSSISGANSIAGLHLDAVARIFFRLERSIFILSEAQSFLPLKIELLDICQRIIGDDPAHFNLRYHSVIDILCYLLRGTQRCWLPATFDPLDEDFIFVSSALVEQFLSVTRKKIFDHKDSNSLHYLAGVDNESPIQTMIAKSSEDHHIVETANLRRQKSRGYSSLGLETADGDFASTHFVSEKDKCKQRYLKSVESLLQQIVKRISWLHRSVSYWELDTNDAAARRICYVLLLLRLFGASALQEVIPDFQSLRSVIFQLLVDPSLGLSSYLGVESKCLQVLSLCCLHQGTFDQSLQCYEYLTKIILSNPEMLSERRRSEYQREQLSIDGPLSPIQGVGGGGLLGFSPPREFLLYGHTQGSSSAGSGPIQSIAMETSNLFGAQLQLLYDAVNMLLILSEVDRSVRRKLVGSCSGLLDCLGYYTPVDPIVQRPALLLVASFIEFAPKFELEAEEAIVSLMIRNLNSPLHYVRYQACNLIYHIGLESPGFVFRGLSRREVEDPVLDIISHSPFEYPRLIVSAIKAAATLVHNFNIKPVWVPSSILYHWRCYQPHLAHRPLLGISGLALVVNLLRHAQVPYRLLYFTYTLSLSASLMYACSELTGNPNPDDMRALQELKDYLIENILPWLPLAIDFISLGKRKRRFDFLEMLPPTASESSNVIKETTTSSLSSRPSTSSQPKAKESTTPEKTAPPSLPNLPANIEAILKRLYSNTCFLASASILSAAETNESTSSDGAQVPLFHTAHHNLWSYVSVVFSLDDYDDSSSVIGDVSTIGRIRLYTREEREKLFPTSTATSTLRSTEIDEFHISTVSEQCEQTAIDALKSKLPSTTQIYRQYSHPIRGQDLATSDNIYRSKSMEFLTVKTVDALYAFLCMDDMYPLSTYLRYTHLFEHCHVIASVSYFMSEHYENTLVLKRGLDLLKYFSDHQMQLSSIAMHSPPALVAVIRSMQDSLEAQVAFAKIILAINRTDDEFARENLMRFRIHQVLLELVLRETNADLVRICIQALLALAATDSHVLEIARIELPAELAPKSKPGYGGSSSSSSKDPPVVLVGTGPLTPDNITTNSAEPSQKRSNRRASWRGRAGLGAAAGETSNRPDRLSDHHDSFSSTTMLDDPSSLAFSTKPFAIIPTSHASTTTTANSSNKTLTKSSSAPSINNVISNPQTINLVDIILYVIETQTKELRTHYYALRLLVLIESQYKNGVLQVLRKSPLANALKKSKKMLKKTYIDDAIAAAALDAHNLSSSNSANDIHSSNRGISTDNSAATGKGEDIERRDVEQLLNEQIIKNDRCVIS